MKNAYYSAQRRFKRYHGRQPENSTELVNFFETVVLGRDASPDHRALEGSSSISGSEVLSSKENGIPPQIPSRLPNVTESSSKGTTDQANASSTPTPTPLQFPAIQPCLAKMKLPKHQERWASTEVMDAHVPTEYFIESVQTDNGDTDTFLPELAMDLDLGTHFTSNYENVWKQPSNPLSHEDNGLPSNPSLKGFGYDPLSDQLDTRSVSSDDADMLSLNSNDEDEEKGRRERCILPSVVE